MVMEEKPKLKPHQMEWTSYEWSVLSLLGQQRAISLDHLPHFLNQCEGPSSTSSLDHLKSTTHNVIERLQRAGLVTMRRMDRNISWVWLSKGGLRALGIASSRKTPPRASLPSLYAANAIRLLLGDLYPRGVWINRKQLLLEQKGQRFPLLSHLPTAEFDTGEGDYLAIYAPFRRLRSEEQFASSMIHQLQRESGPGKPYYTQLWYYATPASAMRLRRARAQVLQAFPETEQRLRLFSYPLVPSELLHRSAYAPVTALAWSPDGEQIATLTEDATFEVWSATTGCIRFSTQLSAIPSALAWSPRGEWIAIGDQDGRLSFWDAITGKLLSLLPDHIRMVTGLAWSPPNTAIVASCATQGSLQMLNLDQGLLMWEVQGHPDGAWTLAWSPDGTRLALGGDDEYVRIYDAVTGRCLASLKTDNALVSAVSWSPDNQWIASAGDTHSIQIWEVGSNTVIHTLPYDAWDGPLAWSPDGERLVWVEEREWVMLWEKGAGLVRQIYGGHGSPVQSLIWSPDGTRLASGSRDGLVHLYRMPGRQIP